MTDKPSREQLDKEVARISKDLKELGKEIEMMIETIGKRDRIGKDMAPDVLNALLIKEPFVLSPPLKDHYEIGQIEDLANHLHMKTATSTK
jgi:hypothetical protein